MVVVDNWLDQFYVFKYQVFFELLNLLENWRILVRDRQQSKLKQNETELILENPRLLTWLRVKMYNLEAMLITKVQCSDGQHFVGIIQYNFQAPSFVDIAGFLAA